MVEVEVEVLGWGGTNAVAKWTSRKNSATALCGMPYPLFIGQIPMPRPTFFVVCKLPPILHRGITRTVE
jgi:hypothetical protein